jgi:hypothetical protein
MMIDTSAKPQEVQLTKEELRREKVLTTSLDILKKLQDQDQAGNP